MIGDPIGIYRHHKSCQLGNLAQDNCTRPTLKGKHYGLRICAFHKKRIEAIQATAIREGTIGEQHRRPVRARRSAA